MITKHFPLGTFEGQTVAFSAYYQDTFETGKKYPYMICGHGLGEARGNLLDMTGVLRVFNWGAWGDLKRAAEKYGFILLFVNTKEQGHYSSKEYQKVAEWAEKNLPVDTNNLALFGHSLGSRGVGLYALTDTEFAKKVNVWFCSSSGPYTDNPLLWKNIIDNNIKVWAWTAENDTDIGTMPKYCTWIADKLKAINPNHPVVLTVFPSTRWPTTTGIKNQNAHNQPIGVMNNVGVTQLTISRGYQLPNPTASKMDIYQWWLSNPKGSIYQPPTSEYTGPKYPEQPKPEPIPEPTPVEKVTLIGVGGRGPIELVYSDGSKEIIKAPEGETFWAYTSLILNKVTVDFSKSPTKIFGPVKT
jgi:hypothetical protein